jgi:hypothetical protein
MVVAPGVARGRALPVAMAVMAAGIVPLRRKARGETALPCFADAHALGAVTVAARFATIGALVAALRIGVRLTPLGALFGALLAPLLRGIEFLGFLGFLLRLPMLLLHLLMLLRTPLVTLLMALVAQGAPDRARPVVLRPCRAMRTGNMRPRRTMRARDVRSGRAMRRP